METHNGRVWSRYNISMVRKILADALSRLTLNGNQETTRRKTYQQENVSEINYTKELPEVTFPIS